MNQASAKTAEYHVASFIMQIDVSQDAVVRQSIEATPGAEIHADNGKGKIVFTIESDNQKHIGNYADELKYQPGVLTLAPVYHQYLEE
ncbi:chaperone NapD [Thalassomonas sp. M1454]|uniref:chaperone NapD n=1 Tax=Thalassomonas sp. M1454 TaxID=2594477 RepID=UPI00163D71B7|nr:chaperone NapD [Thalassomonas sp. M1454]